MKKIFFAIWLILSGKSFSQGEWKQFLPDYKNIPYPAEVTVVKVDKQNNIWFGTSGYNNEYGDVGGLAKYDGKNWRQYLRSNSTLPDGYVTAIEFDLQDNAWIGMKDSGLVVIKNDTVKAIREPLQFIKKGTVKSILADKKGNIWFLYSNVQYQGGIYKPSTLMKYDGVKWNNFNIDSMASSGITAIALDMDDNLYAGGYNEIFKLVGNSWTKIALPVESSVSSLSFDAKNVLWVGVSGYNSTDKILLFDNGIWKSTIEKYSLYEPTQIIFDKSGNTWVASANGLAKFNGNNWQYFTRTNSGVLWDGINSIVIDTIGTLWCGTPFGACSLNGTTWKYFRYSEGLPYEKINKILVDTYNNKWIATDHFGLAMFNGSTWEIFDKSNSNIPFNDINDIAIDEKHKLWVTTGNGLGVFDGHNWFTYNEANTGYPINNLSKIEIDKNGKIWLTSFDKNALFGFDGTSWEVFDSTNSILPNTFRGQLGISPDNKIWLGTNDGLFIYDRNSWINYNVSNSALPDNWVQCIAFDSSGNSWLGTSNGVVKINNGIWEVFTPSNSSIVGWDATDVSIDRNDNVWAGFYWHQGISKYDGKTWKNFNHIFDPTALGGIEVLSICFDNDNNLWIGTLYQGLLEFNMDKIVSVGFNGDTPDEKDNAKISVYPNPFNSQTKISFILSEVSLVEIKIYAITGQLVFSSHPKEFPSGFGTFRFQSENLASGVYLCSLEITPNSKSINKHLYIKKLLLIK